MAARAHPLARRSGGLTLIELMIGLAICALLMSLAVPSLSHVMQRQRLKAAALGFEVDLREARYEAVRRGAPMHVTFAQGTDWCYAIATRADCDCRIAQPCRVKAVRSSEHRGVKLVQAAPVNYEPETGRATDAGGGAVWQTDNGQRVRVGLTPMGRPSACVLEGQLPPLPGC